MKPPSVSDAESETNQVTESNDPLISPDSSVEPSDRQEVEQPAGEAGRRPARGLWSVMKTADSPDEVDSIAEPGEISAEEEQWLRSSRSNETAADFPQTAEQAASATSAELLNGPSLLPVESEEWSAEPHELSGRQPQLTPPAPPVRGASPSAAPATETVPRPRSRMAVLSLAAGGLSAPLSLLAFLSPFWMRIPASIAGFLGLAAGLAAWNELSSRRARTTGKSLALMGVLTGLAGMFLGPLLFAPWGASVRERAGRGFTQQNLEILGDGLARYDEVHQQFPAGGVFQKSLEGREIPMHGWMTALLPYIGESSLYESIRLRLPYTDPENLAAMSREVPAYLASGGSRTPIGPGFAPAHFSGVGGSLVVPGQGLVHLGVFDHNSAVRRQDVVDGLSKTLVVGEIATFYPPWGEPENWRAIGEGINRQPRGFGNADGTGSLFLKADGSVQFFPTKTSPEILRKLSTRDGGEIESP